LRRAFTTAAIFMETLNIHYHQSQKREIIYILPCSHELTGSSDNSLFPPEAAENKSICLNPYIREEPRCNPNCLMNKHNECDRSTITRYQINWNYYDNTFKKWLTTERSVCKKKNMIQFIFDIINNEQLNLKLNLTPNYSYV